MKRTLATLSRPAQAQLSAIPEQVTKAFTELFENTIKNHPACKHDLFPYMARTAQEGRLTPLQFARYRKGMFSRVFTTVPSIFELGKQAFLKGDYATASTSIQNIKEEGAEGNIALMHPLLMQKSFNVLGKAVFGLEPVTMKACYDSPALPEEIIYRHTAEKLYTQHGALVSYMQEFASGGDNSERNPGMMGDMYRLFYHYKDAIPRKIFMQEVRPYFAFHITLDKETHQQVFKGDAIEFQHGERAREDALRQFSTPEDIEAALPHMLAFLEVQNNLFNAILRHVEKAKTMGKPVAAREPEKTGQLVVLADAPSHLPQNHQKPVDFKSLIRPPVTSGRAL
jgi:hypothetical protein